MDFFVYDLALLVIFVVSVSFFLYTRKHNLKRDGLMFLYRTQWGIKLIERTGKRFQKTLKALSYVSVAMGYVLMATMLYFLGKIAWVYAFSPEIVRAIKVPPVIPLVPYLPQIFNLDFLPSFFFVYWIAILAVIAITHEFAHGIFAIRNKVKVKTTGFGFFPYFLPVFLAAFVELDEKKMVKKPIFSQLSVLSAGTFANVLTAIVSLGVLILFFFAAFAPSGIVFDSYSYRAVPLAAITMINGISMDNPTYDIIVSASNISNGSQLNKIEADNKSFLITGTNLESQKDLGYLIAYDDAPAINNRLDAVILKINGVKISSTEEFRNELGKYSPGEKIILTTKGNETTEKEIILAENPENRSLAFLGVGFADKSSGNGISGKIVSIVSSFRNSNVHYEPRLGEFSMFIYNFLWWLVLISISVALVNMLPMGIFDGGRFFYLTALAITKNESLSKKIFSYMTYFLLFIVLLLVFFWIIAFV